LSRRHNAPSFCTSPLLHKLLEAHALSTPVSSHNVHYVPPLFLKAKLVKSAVVKVPRSVYAAIPGRNKYRPSQETPIDNFVLAGCWTSQKFLG